MISKRFPCPCCGYPTLTAQNEWEICILCHWEDDGQDDSSANQILGGPNGKYSLTMARKNFEKYLIMYSPDSDTRIVPEDWPGERSIKASLIKSFEKLKNTIDKTTIQLIWQQIYELEQKLDEITSQKIKQYESSLLKK